VRRQLFNIRKNDGELNFTFSANTFFRLNDKTVTCGSLQVGQHVNVVFVPGEKPVVMYVLIHVTPGTNTQSGGGGGAGTPVK